MSSIGTVGQHIQVHLRCRPPKQGEDIGPINVDSDDNTVTVNEKTFAFDHVFPDYANQLLVYNTTVKPLIEQVLLGFNCTVLAYGSTGTGKTYTMEGKRSNEDLSWERDPECGLIPRAMSQLIETLRDRYDRYSVLVSFIELYNEDTYDLLGSPDDTTRLKIFDDVHRKGSVIIGNLNQVCVTSKDEIFDILRQGTLKRQKAATLLNACSSRSHTIFTVTVKIIEGSINNEECLKISKLNLVDLAGNENIARSGAHDKRARETGTINQSLLTLGRVITSLVEKRMHIPYRESKLTRILQDSLGGQTQTCLIATISPSASTLDETLNTLEYACKVKKITNQPKINEKQTARREQQEQEILERLAEQEMRIRNEVAQEFRREIDKFKENEARRYENYKKQRDNEFESNEQRLIARHQEQINSIKAQYEDNLAQYENIEKKLLVCHQEEINSIKAQYDDNEQKLLARHQEEINSIKAHYGNNEQKLLARHQEEINSIKTQYEDNEKRSLARHQEEINSIKAQYESSEQKLLSHHQQEINSIKAQYESSEQKLLSRHQQEINSIKAQYDDNEQKLISRHQGEINSIKTQYENSEQKLLARHQEEINSIKGQYENNEQKLLVRHHEEINSIRGQYESNEKKLLARHQEQIDSIKAQYDDNLAQHENTVADYKQIKAKNENYEREILELQEKQQSLSREINYQKHLLQVKMDCHEKEIASLSEELQRSTNELLQLREFKLKFEQNSQREEPPKSRLTRVSKRKPDELSQIDEHHNDDQNCDKNNMENSTDDDDDNYEAADLSSQESQIQQSRASQRLGKKQTTRNQLKKKSAPDAEAYEYANMTFENEMDPLAVPLSRRLTRRKIIKTPKGCGLSGKKKRFVHTEHDHDEFSPIDLKGPRTRSRVTKKLKF